MADPNIDITSALEDIVDLSKLFGESVERLKVGLDGFDGKVLDLAKSLQSDAAGALEDVKSKSKTLLDSVYKQQTQVQEDLKEGIHIAIPDISPMILAFDIVRKDLMTMKGITDAERASRIASLTEQQKKLMEINNEYEISASYMRGSERHAKTMSREFGSFIEDIPYIGNILSSAMNIDGIRDELGEKLKSALYTGLKDPTKMFSAIKKMGAATFDAFGQMSKNAFANPWVMIIALAAMAVKRFLSLEKAVADFRQETGLAGDQTKVLEKYAQNINVEMSNMGVSIESVYKSMSAVTEEFGSTNLISRNMVKNVALFSSAMGVSEKASVGFAKNLASISGTSLDTATNMQGWVYQLAKSANVAPAKVIEDIANASDDTLIAFGGFPDKLAAAAVQARMLGTNINEISKSTRGLLNFQSSISAEMEASTLLGRNINLQKARQLRFEGDVVGAQQELLRVVRQAGDLNSMNVFQQEALAKATGMSVAEMRKQLVIQDNLARMGRDINDLDKVALDALGQRKDMSEEELNILARQSDQRADQAKMMGELKSIIMGFSQILVPIVSIVSSILVPVLRIVGNLMRSFLKPIQDMIENVFTFGEEFKGAAVFMEKALKVVGLIGTALGTVVAWNLQFYVQLKAISKLGGIIVKPFLKILSVSKKIGNMINKIKSVPLGIVSAFGVAEIKIVNILAKMGKLGTFLFDILMGAKAFKNVLPVIGWVIFGVEAFINVVKDLFKIWGSSGSLAEKIVSSFFAIPKALIKTFISPFVMIIDWIGKLFGADKLGTYIGDALMGAVDAWYGIIKSPFVWLIDFLSSGEIGSTIWEAYSTSFKRIGNFISEFATGMRDKIVSGVQDLPGIIFTALKSPFTALWEWLSGTFFGNSPSQLGLNILKGISSSTDLIFDVLLAPFKAVGNFAGKIFDKFFGENRNDPTESLANSLSSVSDEKLSLMKDVAQLLSSDLLSSNILKTAESIDGLAESINGISTIKTTALTLFNNRNTKEDKKNVEPIKEVHRDNNEKVVEKLSELIKLLQGGSIAVNLDGRKISKALVNQVY